MRTPYTHMQEQHVIETKILHLFMTYFVVRVGQAQHNKHGEPCVSLQAKGTRQPPKNLVIRPVLSQASGRFIPSTSGPGSGAPFASGGL